MDTFHIAGHSCGNPPDSQHQGQVIESFDGLFVAAWISFKHTVEWPGHIRFLKLIRHHPNITCNQQIQTVVIIPGMFCIPMVPTHTTISCKACIVSLVPKTKAFWRRLQYP